MNRRNFLKAIGAGVAALPTMKSVLLAKNTPPYASPIPLGHCGLLKITLFNCPFSVRTSHKEIDWENGGTTYKDVTFETRQFEFTEGVVQEPCAFVPVNEASNVEVITENDGIYSFTPVWCPDKGGFEPVFLVNNFVSGSIKRW